MKTPRTQHKNQRLFWSTAIILLAVSLGGYLVFASQSDIWPFAQNDNTQNQQESEINYSPPTESEIENSQNGKKNSGDPEPQNPNESDSSRNISVEITYASAAGEAQLDIRAFTPDVIEGSGTCIATLKKGPETVSASSKAFIDASSSICEPIEIPLSKFQSDGVWSLIVTYSSPTSNGTSAMMEVQI